MSKKANVVHKESSISRLFLVSVLVLSVSIFVFSQDEVYSSGGSARHISLGGGHLNPFLDDAMRIHINPALLLTYKDFFFGDIGFLTSDVLQGSGRTQYLGANVNIADDFNAAIILNKRESPLYNSDITNYSLDPMSGLNNYVFNVGMNSFGRPLSPVELAVAYRFPKLQLGASISIGGWSKTDDNINRIIEQSSRTTRLKVGGSMQIHENLFADAAFLFGFNNVEGTFATTNQSATLEMDGGTEYGFDTKLQYLFNEKLTIIPVGRIYSFTWEPKFSTVGMNVPSTISEWSNSVWEAGIGINYTREKLLISGGASIQVQKFTKEDRPVTNSRVETITDLPKITVGCEWTFTEWFIARIGYFNRFSSSKIETTTNGTTTYSSSTELPWYNDPNNFSAGQQRITLGVGFRFWDFALDGAISEGLLINGPWFVTGVNQSLFSVLSAHYQL